jgi:hyperosmotically inducible protein
MKRKLIAVLVAAALAAPAVVLAQATNAPRDTGTSANTGMAPPKDGAATDRPVTTTTTPSTKAPAATSSSSSSRMSEAEPKAKSGTPDSIITGKIKSQFIKDKIVRSRSYNVDTADKVVTVRGTARSQAEADRAIEIAKGTEGVSSVKNEIKVQAAADQPKSNTSASTSTKSSTSASAGTKSSTRASGPSATSPSDPSAKAEMPEKNQGVATAGTRDRTASTGSTSTSSTSTSKEGGSPDALITTKIKAEHAKDKDVSATRINVDTNAGVVTLSGTAKSQAEAEKAVTLAKNVKGVTSVKNNIKVEAK